MSETTVVAVGLGVLLAALLIARAGRRPPVLAFAEAAPCG